MRRLSAVLVAAAFVVGACGGGSNESGAPGAGASVDSAEVLDFDLPAVGGGRINGADYDDKALALWFWAPW